MQRCRTGTSTCCVEWLRASEGAGVAVLKQAQQTCNKHEGAAENARHRFRASVACARTVSIFASVRGIERLPLLSAELRWRGAEVQVPLILEEAVTGAEKAESRRRNRPASFPSAHGLFGTCWCALTMQRCRTGTRTRCVAWMRASEGAGVAFCNKRSRLATNTKEPPKPPVIFSERPWHAHARWQNLRACAVSSGCPNLAQSFIGEVLRCRCRRSWRKL